MKLKNPQWQQYFKIKYLFSLTLLFGTFSIVIGTQHSQSYITILTVIALMLGYFFTGTKLLYNELLSMDQFADSNYYLGFLFTLMSLGASLYVLSQGTVGSDIFVKLIGQFGLSISTTIVGLSMRIYLLSFSPTMDSNIESFNMVIFEKLHMLKDHIHETIDQTKNFSEIIDTKINIFAEQTQKNIDDYNTRLYATFDEEVTKNIFQKIAYNIDELQQGQQKGFEYIYQNIKKVHDTFNENNTRTQGSLLNSIEDSKSSVDQFSEQIKEIRNNIVDNNIEVFKSTEAFTSFVETIPMIMQQQHDSLMNANKQFLNDITSANTSLLQNYTNKQDLNYSEMMKLFKEASKDMSDKQIEAYKHTNNISSDLKFLTNELLLTQTKELSGVVQTSVATMHSSLLETNKILLNESIIGMSTTLVQDQTQMLKNIINQFQEAMYQSNEHLLDKYSKVLMLQHKELSEVLVNEFESFKENVISVRSPLDDNKTKEHIKATPPESR